MPKAEVYVSVDIETDGPIPGPYSMLSFGAACFDSEGKLLDALSANLTPLPGASVHAETLAFWQANREAYSAMQVDQIEPGVAMTRFVEWVQQLPGKPVFVAYPAGFDFTFMYWYMIRFVGRSPFSFSALDMKSYAMAKLELPFRKAVKSNMPKEWFSEERHSHIALEDAIEQGRLFVAMLRAGKH